jgi:hypothetical protein
VLVARCEIDSIAEIKGEETLMIVKALNEFDSKITGVDWRQKLDNQRGAVSGRCLGFSALSLYLPSEGGSEHHASHSAGLLLTTRICTVGL